MKHHLLCCFTYLLIIASSCNSMENIHQEKILREITIIEKPYAAQYLQKDRAIIFGESGCSIINPLTNEKIKKISDLPYHNYSSFALSPNKKKVALSHNANITMYDIDTGNKKMYSFPHSLRSATFSPQEPFILLCSGYKEQTKIIKLNYITNQSEIYDIPFLCPNIAFHPTQNFICTGNTKNEIFIYSLDNLKKPIKQGNFKNSIPYYYQYNQDGSFIIAVGVGDIYIIDTDLNSVFSSLRHEKKDFWNATMNANNTIVAVLSEHNRNFDHFIEYYDIKSKKFIYSTKIGDNNPGSSYNLSFSPDEKELMIILRGKCFVIPTSYHHVIFMHWMLKNYQLHHPEIPNDVVNYIIKYL
jgi:hypothetical protein